MTDKFRRIADEYLEPPAEEPEVDEEEQDWNDEFDEDERRM